MLRVRRYVVETCGAARVPCDVGDAAITPRKVAFDIDFLADITVILADRMRALGYEVPFVLSHEEVRIRYFNLQHRLVPRRPRRIHRASVFTCPAEMTVGLALLEAKLIAGDDLRPHLSRGITKPRYNDGLLNDWGIVHFHLGTQLEPDGFIGRTGPVLFARIEADDAYLIDVRAHGSWASRELLEAVHRDWPETIEKYRAIGASNVEFGDGKGQLDENTLTAFRRAGASILHELAPGEVYVSPGGGYVQDRTSFVVVRRSDDLANRLCDWQQAVLAAETRIRDDVRSEHGVQLPDPARVRLALGDFGEFVAVFYEFVTLDFRKLTGC